MADNRVKLISDLDFEDIKANISSFIANNSEFTDYNFKGSALNFLTDILAYNTHYNAFYLNMAINENFIDTAVTRSSVVSLAKNFGYTPRSKKSSIAEVSFTVSTTDPNGTSITMDQTNFFSTSVNNVTYVFTPIASQTATAQSGLYTFNDVKLREGSYATITYPVTSSPNEKFQIDTFNIDLDSVQVSVQVSESDTNVEPYSLISDITKLTPESKIFYMFETTDKKYSIEFGDGVLGYKPSPGNIVIIRFQTSSGADANGASSFTLVNEIVGNSLSSPTIEFTNVVNSYGGDAEEKIDSIRLNALQNFRTQGRAVTAEDYKFFISRDYPLAQTISVWGGQDNDPPIYGKVFISFKPVDGYFLSNAAKKYILDEIIKKKNIVSIIPEIVDPEYLFLEISTDIKFNNRKTLNSAAEIKNLVLSQIQNFNDTTLTQFGTNFNYSKFSTLIDSTDPSITGNITTLKMRKNVPIILNKLLTYNIDFQNGIHPGSLENKFPFKAVNDSRIGSPTEDLFIDDDEKGVVRIFKYTGPGFNVKSIVNANAGTINYTTGKVVLSDFSPSLVNTDLTLDFVAKPVDYSIGDISSYRNTIITILDTDIKVDVQVA